MSWSEAELLLRGCAANPPAAPEDLSAALSAVPRDYAEVLAKMNGIEGFVTKNQYLMLWRAQEIRELNEAYAVAEN